MTNQDLAEITAQLETIAKENGVVLHNRPGSVLKIYAIMLGESGEPSGEHCCYFQLADCFGAMQIPKDRFEVGPEALKTINKLKTYATERAK